MLTVAALGQSALSARLRGPGLRLQTGPVIACIRSRVPALSVALERMYGDYPVREDDIPADFDVLLRRPRGLRRLVKPQVYFHYDGMEPFQPLPLARSTRCSNGR